MTEQEKYLEGHRNCGIKVGDRVRVTRKAESYEGGWNFSWHPDFDNIVGKTTIVEEDIEVCGFVCDNGYFSSAFLPYFVLEKI